MIKFPIMATFTAKLDTRKLFRQLRKFKGSVLPLTAQHFFLEGENIIGDAKEQYVPVDTGALRASGHTRKPRTSGSKVSVELGFGGPAASYALFVHEDLNARHTVGSAKYLEIPFKRAVPGMSTRLAARIRREMKRQFRG